MSKKSSTTRIEKENTKKPKHIKTQHHNINVNTRKQKKNEDLIKKIMTEKTIALTFFGNKTGKETR